ncbi:MAG TPA: hypothetical protein VKA18_08530 [Alphaproteobacteria bacterium]|nr:hypothetical protein [Alphaproteobacteria bacterium]
MTAAPSFYDRRRALEASFDGPIPRSRLSEPDPARKAGSTHRLIRQIADRRACLSPDEARADEALGRLCRHLTWLVMSDRH